MISYIHHLWDTVYGELIFTHFTDEIVDQLMLMFSVCVCVRARFSSDMCHKHDTILRGIKLHFQQMELLKIFWKYQEVASS
jgi:hypothetical protein